MSSSRPVRSFNRSLEHFLSLPAIIPQTVIMSKHIWGLVHLTSTRSFVEYHDNFNIAALPVRDNGRLNLIRSFWFCSHLPFSCSLFFISRIAAVAFYSSRHRLGRKATVIIYIYIYIYQSLGIQGYWGVHVVRLIYGSVLSGEEEAAQMEIEAKKKGLYPGQERRMALRSRNWLLL
ncbi:hypothetical protein B0T19DRAFT_31284 [Cercophora scortea]|uniref:Uncharacterized protein n=1 Tax=Cercophora scortea TaxID=314031 RepID=A0AAE0J429_9PEZI|nr:hypothetical protein B0T19DRAFT_31284 [Cercophora scortea]